MGKVQVTVTALIALVAAGFGGAHLWIEREAQQREKARAMCLGKPGRWYLWTDEAGEYSEIHAHWDHPVDLTTAGKAYEFMVLYEGNRDSCPLRLRVEDATGRAVKANLTTVSRGAPAAIAIDLKRLARARIDTTRVVRIVLAVEGIKKGDRGGVYLVGLVAPEAADLDAEMAASVW